MRTKLVAVCVLGCLAVGTARAGPVLDDILNYMFMDQSVPMKGPEQLFDVQRTLTLTKDEPVGQTFVTGPETAKIVRIRVFLNPSNDWQAGEGAELVLWDSPEKKLSLGRYTIRHEFRGYHYSQVEFEIDAAVRPDTKYYFEISYTGSGDGMLSQIGAMNGADGYKPGQGYLAGKESDFDVCFQVHSKRAPNRVANLKKAFARFKLDLPELSGVKEAVEKEDFETAEARLVAYFEARQKPVAIIDPKDVPAPDPAYDTRDGDMAMLNYFNSKEAKGYAGPDLNWHAAVDFDAKGHLAAEDFDLNRYAPRGITTTAYMKTGNEKYARKFNDMMVDWFLDNPPPGESHIGGVPWDPVWASLQAGIRLGHGFYAYSKVHSSPSFTLDCRMAYILDLADHADTLVLNGGSAGGNWSFTQNSSMLGFALNHPEYTNAGVWQETASSRIAASIKKDWLPDGVETESAPGYQRFSYRPLTNVYDLTKERGVQTPFASELKGLLETQAEYFMHLAMPNGFTPFLGDWGDDQQRGSLREDSKRFDRPDMLYVSTAGKEGTKPKDLSKLYPYAGIVTMRSDWGDTAAPRGLGGDTVAPRGLGRDTVAPPLLRRGLGGGSFEDSRYLMLHGVHYGAHGHSDLNGITLYAYGRELLTDPGSHIYGSPEHAKLTTAPSHNLMTIDDANQRSGADAAFRNWSSTPIADYLSSWGDFYKGGAYNREVFYARSNGDPGAGDYWIVRDTAEGSGTHSLEQRWHFAIGEAKLDKASLTATTAFADKGNLAVMQVSPSRLQAEETTTDTWRPRGKANDPRKLPTVIYKTSAALPAAIDTVLVPFEGTQGPKAQLKVLETSPDGLDSAFKVVQPPPNPLLGRGGAVVDLIVMRKSAGSKSLAGEKVSFDGERLFLRRIGGTLRSLLLVNGTSVTISGKQILKAERPAKWVAVSFDKAGVSVFVGSDDVKVLVPGAGSRRVTITNTHSDALIGLDRNPGGK